MTDNKTDNERIIENQRWQIDYMCDSIAKILGLTKQSPADTVESVNQLQKFADERCLWQPMETAPKDTDVLLFLCSGMNIIVAGRWFEKYGGYVTKPALHQCNPTHWMPLPPPPEVS